MVDLLVIQPTPFCNINCSYCYLGDRSNKNRISLDTIKNIIHKAIKDKILGKEVTIVWHAGEPMVIPHDYFDSIVTLSNSILNKSGVKAKHAIQTNGTLITQEWCELIIKHNISIGISMDGPEFIHDENRKTRSGKGTFKKIIKGIELLKSNNIKYHGIAVITSKSLTHACEIFNFFYNHGFYHLGINIEEVEGINNISSAFNQDYTEHIYSFYKDLFNAYIQSDQSMRIREFDNCFNAILRNPRQHDIRKQVIHSHQLIPFGIISIDYLGNYSTFSPELLGQNNDEYNNFIVGNINTSSFKEGKSNKILNHMLHEINMGVEKCKKECDFFNVCGGGAPSNKFYENKTFNSTETQYCKYTIKTPTSIVLDYLELLIK